MHGREHDFWLVIDGQDDFLDADLGVSHQDPSERSSFVGIDEPQTLKQATHLDESLNLMKNHGLIHEFNEGFWFGECQGPEPRSKACYATEMSLIIE